MGIPDNFRKTAYLLIFVMVIIISGSAATDPSAGSVQITVRDTKTGGTIGGAMVYFDGGYAGITSNEDPAGILQIPGVGAGTHTLRVTGTGSKEATKKFSFPDEKNVTVTITRSPLVPLIVHGTGKNGINVVFYPSATSFSCSGNTKVATPLYLSNETRFRTDVMEIINSTYLDLQQITSPPGSLPEDYRDRFNFYYYYDPTSPADAFSGCAGSVPRKYWDDVTFADVTVILYPTYYGIYDNPSCQPTGCSEDHGPGRKLMKAPADRTVLFDHETGHSVFGLVDTYCGDTYYYQNDPYPNTWSSLDACITGASLGNRDPAQCQQIEEKSSGSRICSRDFWKWDPAPDIMANGYSGKYGAAATQRIRYVLSQSGSG